MTAEATRIRNRRQHFARPGGSHDRLVAFLARALPAGIGVMAAIMILAPLSPRGEVSFLLDRNKVAVTRERLAVSNADYRGKDDRNREFLVTAGSAVQKTATLPIVEMLDLKAQLTMADGPSSITATRGVYDYDKEKLDVEGPVEFSAPAGYHMTTNGLRVDMKTQTATGSGGVNGTVPSGTFSANSMTTDLANRTVTLEGRAHMRMVPGKLRTPQ